jgi:hypothetical protein
MACSSGEYLGLRGSNRRLQLRKKKLQKLYSSPDMKAGHVARDGITRIVSKSLNETDYLEDEECRLLGCYAVWLL